MKEERKLAQEMERERKHRELEAQKAAMVEGHIHDAATRIACRYRVNQAKGQVQQKRLHHHWHEAKEDQHCIHAKTCVIQRNFRRYSTRKFFSSHGVDFSLKRLERKARKPGEKAAPVADDALHARIDSEVTNGRVSQTTQLFADMLQNYVNALEVTVFRSILYIRTFFRHNYCTC